MKSKATRIFSVVQGDTCQSTFPNLLLVFYPSLFRTVLIQNPGHHSPNNFIFPATASPRRVVFKFSCAYVCQRTSVQVDGPKVGAVITQIQRTDRRATAGCTPVVNSCPRAAALADITCGNKRSDCDVRCDITEKTVISQRDITAQNSDITT
jgi:hypothetical protein